MLRRSIVLACADSVFLSRMRAEIEENFYVEQIENIEHKAELWDYLRRNKPEVLVICTDFLDRGEQVAQVRQLVKTSKVIICGEDSVATAVAAMASGADYYIASVEDTAFISERLQAVTGLGKISASVWTSRLDSFIGHQFTNPSLTLSALCGHFGISSAYATRLFRENFGITFHGYLSLYRVEKAKCHLVDTRDRIYEIADKCGFANSSHLIRIFLKVTNMTPGQYRKALKETEWLGFQSTMSADGIPGRIPGQPQLRRKRLKKRTGRRTHRYDKNIVKAFLGRTDLCINYGYGWQ